MRRNKFLDQVPKHLIIWFILIFTFFPVVWTISASLRAGGGLVGQRLIPEVLTFEHYSNLKEIGFFNWIKNSLIVSLTTAILTVFFVSLAAYAFSRFNFWGKKYSLLTLLILQMFPAVMGMVAVYLLLFHIGKYIPFLGLNTLSGLIMVYLGGGIPYNIWLMKGFFDSIPDSLEESALIDGATRFQAYYKIILPLATPILAVVAINSFIGTYSDFLLASIILKDPSKYTFAVGLRNFISGLYDVRWGDFAAASIVGALPIVILFLSLQNLIVSGLTRGAVKE
ncbi:sugar ABC transporter permease [Dictyoglomus thermophilum]|uniref:Maltose/maltodextrin transport system permease protein MalG n=2 Tax=Dictyoglomus thermophilum TaxID=14 RepID=B5YD22_DICT6|nr:sugar ABC transporter permease [Dictyoglomus thermophilum]ACI19004.1 maltose ABC transporter, permease protein [Dictyoglomus thermophilum H-6-12]MCX7720288.1 sugar ABC transporter permease [Dictyoglomus thermophilum]TYT23251.1 sugar ABC transporter permease [Dictyoglomus thermophilum]